MTLQQALAIVSQTCADFRGTLRDHQTIQQALQVIEQALQQQKQPAVERTDAPPAPAAQQ